MPAFVVPFMFTLHPKGAGILLKGPVLDMGWTIITAFLGLTALAAAIENWLLKRTTAWERMMLFAGGLVLIYPVALYNAIGILLLAGAFVSQRVRK
jgi:TRAP-type uncharacterized transport system fused permease subunit